MRACPGDCVPWSPFSSRTEPCPSRCAFQSRSGGRKHVEQAGLFALPCVSEPRIPLIKHLAKFPAQHRKALKLVIEILQLGCSKRADFFAGCSALFPDLEESRQLIQREPDGKRMLYEPNPIYGLRRVLTIPVGRASGMEKAHPLIVAKRICAEPAETGQFR